MSSPQEVPTFSAYPFHDSLREDVAAAGFETPTPIQARCIPPAMEGKDLIGLAQTGTGKTAAFALPIIHRMANRLELGALVLAPTRELVAQIVEVFRALGRSSGVRVASLIGGVKMEKDWKALQSWPNVLVATPGRLIDHLEQKTLSLKEVEIFIVDEADRMHDMGFMPQIRRIIAALPADRQTMMFTATMPADVEQVARRHMRDPLRIQVGLSVPVERAEQKLFQVHETQKTDLLLRLLNEDIGRVLIFMRTKRGVDRLARRIGVRHHRVARIHGDREQNQRNEAMGGFREGRYRILIATDIAARGLDVADIEHVINYDFPRSADDYVHRIGRTARLVAKGRATSFVTPADRAYLRDLEKRLGSKVTLETAQGLPEVPAESHATARHHRHATPSHGSGGQYGRPQRHGSPHGRPAAHGSHQVHASHAAHGSHHAPVTHQAHAARPVVAAAAGAPGVSADDKPRRRRRRRGRGSQSGPQQHHHGGHTAAPQA